MPTNGRENDGEIIYQKSSYCALKRYRTHIPIFEHFNRIYSWFYLWLFSEKTSRPPLRSEKSSGGTDGSLAFNHRIY